MKTINDTLRWGELCLKKAGVTTFKLDTSILLRETIGVSVASLIAHGEDTVNKRQLKNYQVVIRRRAKGEPIAYILGTKEFYGLNFVVNPDVLIPRAETEAMVEQILSYDKKPLMFLDMGTGSGAIAIAVAKNSKQLTITAADVSLKAITIAKKNAKKLVPNKQIEFVGGNLFENINTKYDLIAANLPYVTQNTLYEQSLANEPPIALYGGQDGLDIYREFFSQVNNYINKGGVIFCEVDPNQYKKLTQFAKNVNLVPLNRSGFTMSFTKS